MLGAFGGMFNHEGIIKQCERKQSAVRTQASKCRCTLSYGLPLMCLIFGFQRIASRVLFFGARAESRNAETNETSESSFGKRV